MSEKLDQFKSSFGNSRMAPTKLGALEGATLSLSHWFSDWH